MHLIMSINGKLDSVRSLELSERAALAGIWKCEITPQVYKHMSDFQIIVHSLSHVAADFRMRAGTGNRLFPESDL